MAGRPPRFAVATFKRVFETTPTRDVLTLEELTAGLMRFILKPKLERQVARDVMRIEEAWAAIESGERLGGRRWSILRRAEKRGGREEARRAYERLLQKARGRAKTDLRIWSPTLYREGGRRESDDVVHLSCLVLDYDSGVPIEEASAQWTEWYHVVHTTWSHRPEHPKFRLVLPLAKPVLAEDWRPFWWWGAERAGMRNDPALKSPASNYALPAIRGREQPRQAFVRRAPLLDPLREGLVKRVADPPPDLPPPGPSHWRGDDPDEKFVDHPREPFVAAEPLFVSDEPDESDFDLFGDGEANAREEREGGEPDPWADEFDDLF
ncbi:MAG TPA: hypothetical protein RMH85_26070 [Polyangiaceae bacterium LLY-WYZ-15_(1-7)]|nr:hypothetical protein [Sandaracinus sp.]HJL01512.1 hypothetical protein [Polyangiaceae bacterium LLY-WYZ-15_(1-7)]MBJ73352.1 hypothetical protein [Sandaracinus sp.]HJL11969.1 hypothetical protein [Polyangiaceae bacterium LLY-WYZ-15_(1-7)]HJL21591.1 hypothetical protein [Polyangiaceae bacterium LLY-WYZ-15_(1-7)]